MKGGKMKRKQIIKRLEDIKKIADYQSLRFNDEREINKTITLRLAFNIITEHIFKILKCSLLYSSKKNQGEQHKTRAKS